MRGYGLTGCAGTGKTTLAKDIAHYTGLRFLPSRAAECHEALGFTGKDAIGHLDRLRLQNMILDTHVASIGDGDLFISDRTPYDMAAYLAIALNGAYPDELMDYIWRCEDVVKTYYYQVMLIEHGVIPYADDDKRQARSEASDVVFEALLIELHRRRRGHLTALGRLTHQFDRVSAALHEFGLTGPGTKPQINDPRLNIFALAS